MYKGKEPIKGIVNTNILDFWQWTYSDILINKNRDDLSLFLVAKALELTDMPRIEWQGCELRYRKKKIAVKTSGYIQSWKQTKPKRVLYDISPKKGIDAKRKDSMTFRNREAELYIFALAIEKDVKKMDILNLEQWRFYIVRTAVLDDEFETKKKIGLRALNKLATPVHHSRLKEQIDILIDLELTERMVL